MFPELIYQAFAGYLGGSSKVGLWGDDMPDPIPWWGPWARLVLSMVGGIAAAKLASVGMGADSIIATTIASYAGGKLLSDLGRGMKLVR